ncbi:MAG: phosphonopyruvate decarboxylase [Synergistaceae bacterium]|nr:phosphonopyruvate decarboxylase [Synergistaceae bacterium]
MNVKTFAGILGADFYSGVPDSQLKALCDYLMAEHGLDPLHHIIAANEGNALAIASGYHLATGKIPAVYMQNSGLGNIVNPSTSLTNPEVYRIPAILIIGWRGEPGVHDEPQHIYQGRITLELLDVLGIKHFTVSKETTQTELEAAMSDFREVLDSGHDVAFVVRKGALENDGKISYQNDNSMTREEIIRHVISVSGDDPVISTTGKTSRELFELRATHERDFLTVGSMGHASSIALGVSLQKPGVKVWCIDGDGAAIMHMGAMAVTGSIAPDNLIHIVINNSAHESVGGLPTAAGKICLPEIARACGYVRVFTAGNYDELDEALKSAKEGSGLTFIEAKSRIGSRSDLGRPTTTAIENMKAFSGYLRNMH